jgi:hypothetical protein
MILKQGITWGNKHPKKLFLIDGSGAILSAFLLGIVLVEWERIFGIPRSVLYFLALLPCLFTVYDIYCYRTKSKNIGTLLKGIAWMNLAYCILSMGLAIYHFQKITYFGWSYLILEMGIVITLATLEWKVAGQLIRQIQVSATDQ